MGEISIRPAILDDCERLVELFEISDELHRDALPTVFKRQSASQQVKSLHALLEDPAVIVLAADGGADGLVGALHARRMVSPAMSILHPRRYAMVESVVVRPDRRKQGIGRRLMKWIHRWARDQGIFEVQLTVWEFNEDASRFYEALGYDILRRRLFCKL